MPFIFICTWHSATAFVFILAGTSPRVHTASLSTLHDSVPCMKNLAYKKRATSYAYPLNGFNSPIHIRLLCGHVFLHSPHKEAKPTDSVLHAGYYSNTFLHAHQPFIGADCVYGLVFRGASTTENELTTCSQVKCNHLNSVWPSLRTSQILLLLLLQTPDEPWNVKYKMFSTALFWCSHKSITLNLFMLAMHILVFSGASRETL